MYSNIIRMLYWMLYLFVFLPGAFCSAKDSNNIYHLLRAREIHGRVPTQKFKIALAAIEYPDTVKEFREATNASEFIQRVPFHFCGSFLNPDNNPLRYIMIAGLLRHSEDFRTAVFTAAQDLRDVIHDTHGTAQFWPWLHISSYVKLYTIESLPISLGAGGLKNVYEFSTFQGEASRQWAQMLIEQGADPNLPRIVHNQEIKTQEEVSCLHEFHDLSLVELFIQAGANVHATSSISRQTLLHTARKHPNLVARYLACGVNIDAQNSDGLTALECLLCDNHSPDEHLSSTITSLLDHGARYHHAWQRAREKANATAQILSTERDKRRTRVGLNGWGAPAVNNISILEFKLQKYQDLVALFAQHDAYVQESARLRAIDIS